MRKTLESGQALVLVLLSLAVVLTLVLFILSRTVTDIAVSTSSEEAVRAFSAAEAGVEQALVVGAGSAQDIGNAKYTSQVTGFAENTTAFNYPTELNSGDSLTVWFVSHDTNGNLKCDSTHRCFTGPRMQVCWGTPGSLSSGGTIPAVEVSIFYDQTAGQPASIQIGRAAFDPDATRRGSNSFADPGGSGCTIGGVSYLYGKTFNFSDLGVTSFNSVNGLQFARIRMLYNNGPQTVGITVPGGLNLPSQGQSIVSTGTAGDSNRKLNVFQGWPEVPGIFDYTIYSGAYGLSK